MQVLFVEDVPGTAYAGDIKNVKTGFARNYLLPQKLAVLATPDQMNRVSRLQAAASKRRDVAEKNMSTVANKLQEATVSIEVRAGRNNRLYGSITNVAIADELSKVAGEEIDRRLVITEPIRQLGVYQIPVKLGFGLEPKVTLRVTPIGGVLEEEATAEDIVAEITAQEEASTPEAEGDDSGKEPPESGKTAASSDLSSAEPPSEHTSDASADSVEDVTEDSPDQPEGEEPPNS